ncbi:MAG: exodeoxyribonuclease VII small subunit [Goleter apudmare HA4340-LM2]|jgi:exodeoxyribonuclease VII small subunit|nr:exodeoxyribonuclease VII small subunit [Goleter apudmare HA4340-LM2]
MVKRNSAANSDAAAGWNYEAKVTEIEGIIARIETGELELEEVFDQFVQAVEYLRQCESFLQQRQQQVDLLIETLSDE